MGLEQEAAQLSISFGRPETTSFHSNEDRSVALAGSSRSLELTVHALKLVE